MARQLQPEADIHDVWSRTASKYRSRAILLLLANMVLFGALCCFMFWLRTGWFFPPLYEHYVELFTNTLTPAWILPELARGTQHTLYDLLIEPISLKLVPMQAIVIGLLFASLVAVPILVAILYRLPAALPFCLMVVLLAVLPWLGVCLILSCAIASYGRVKLKFRFAAALLALIPIGVYFFAASQRTSHAVDLLTPQIERGLVIVPFLLSAVAACALIAGALGLAWAVNYRPGAIAPLLAVMFLAPWVLFITQVGRDELHYRFLELTYGPNSEEYFRPADARTVIRGVARRLWIQSQKPRPTIDVFEERVKKYFESQLDPLKALQIGEFVHRESLNQLTVFAEEQYHVVRQCDKFLDDFPKSRYVPSALFLKGRALDMRVDIHAFRSEGTLRFYADFPNEISRSTWETLVRHYPASPLSNVARYRLAQLVARAGEIDRAIHRLEEIFDAHLSARSDERQPESRWQKRPPEASLEKEYVDFPIYAGSLLALLKNNRDPVFGNVPLVAYLRCDRRHVDYHRNLDEIVAKFPGCKIEDNIAVQLALMESSAASRIARLHEVRKRFPDGDVKAEILYELGIAYLENGQLAEARTYFDTIAREHPESSFAQATLHRLPSGRSSWH